jgi:hypothetical protein
MTGRTRARRRAARANAIVAVRDNVIQEKEQLQVVVNTIRRRILHLLEQGVEEALAQKKLQLLVES